MGLFINEQQQKLTVSGVFWYGILLFSMKLHLMIWMGTTFRFLPLHLIKKQRRNGMNWLKNMGYDVRS